MLITQLPNKRKWGRQLQLILKGSKIKKKEICAHINYSGPTLAKVLNGEGTHDQLSEVEQAIIEIMGEE